MAGQRAATRFCNVISTVLVRTENVWRSPVSPLCYVDVPTYNPCGLPLPRTPNVIPIKIETKMTLVDVNLVSMTSSVDPLTEQPAFDRYNNPIDVYEYDFGNGQIGAFIRRTHRSYADVPGSRILAVPSGTWISDDIEGQNKKSLTQYRQISGWLSFSLYESTTNEPLQGPTLQIVDNVVKTVLRVQP